MSNYYNTCLCGGGSKPGATSTAEEQVIQCDKADRKQLYYTVKQSEEEPEVVNAIYPSTHASVVWYKDTGNSVQDVLGSLKTDIVEIQKALQSQSKFNIRIADDCFTNSGVIALSARQGKKLAEEMATIKDSGYESLTKLDSNGYLYNIKYQDYRIEDAEKFFDESTYFGAGACSSFKKGSLMAHNFDANFDNGVEFLVSTPHTFQKNAVLGISAGYIATLTNDIVADCAANHTYNKNFAVVPYTLVDGMNEHGLSCSIHTVPADKLDSLGIGNKVGTIPTCAEEERISIYSTLLPRYILDNFKTVDEAVAFLKDYASVKTPNCILNKNLDNHLFLADKTTSCVVEWVPDENDVWTVHVVEDHNILTNFYIYDVNFLSSGKVYTPEEQVHTGNKPSMNNISDHAAGLERYNALVDGIADIEDKDDALALLLELFYTNVYNAVYAPFWYSEYATKKDLTVNTPTTKSTWGLAIQEAVDLFNARSRSTAETQFSKHSVVYDLDSRKLYMYVQEDETVEIDFCFEEYSKDDIDNMIGNLNDLATENKGNLVEAINELSTKIATIANAITAIEAMLATHGNTLTDHETRIAALETPTEP